MKTRLQCFFSAVLVLSALSYTPLQAQQSVFYIVSGPETPSTAGEPWETQDFLLIPLSAQSGELAAEIFDAGLGSPLDLVLGPANTNTVIDLLTFESAYSKTEAGLIKLPVNKSYDGQAIPNDQSTINRWIPVQKKISYREKGWVLRVRSEGGNDVNAFQIRFNGSLAAWKIKVINPGVNSYGISPDQEIQFQGDMEIHSELLPLSVSGEEDSRVTRTDAFGKNWSPSEPVTDYSGTVLTLKNRWGLRIRGSAFAINNLTVRGADGPAVFDFPGVVVSTPTQPAWSIRSDYSGGCTGFTLSVVNSRGIAYTGNVSWAFKDKFFEGNPVSLNTGVPGDFPVRAYVATTGVLFPAYWTYDGTIRVNTPPVAELDGPPNRLAAGELFTFSARKSTDADGDQMAFRWLVDGNLAGSQPAFQFSSPVPGTFNVSLVVSDISNRLGCNTDTATVQVRVNAQPFGEIDPIPVFANEETVTFRSVRVTDSDSDRLGFTWTGPGVTGNSSGESVSIRHDIPGTYSVKLVIDDGLETGNSSYQTTATYRVNAAPVPRFSLPVQTAPGVPVLLNASASTDADTRQLSYSWRISDNRNLSGPQQTITFDRPGMYTVTLTVNDEERVKNSVQSISRQIQVNAPPVPQITGNTLSAEGFQEFSAERSSDPDHSIVRYRWEFGDGSVASGELVSHTYNSTGRYTVKLTVDDGQNQPNSIQSTTRDLIITRFPVSRFTMVSKTEPGKSVQLDGSASSDPDGSITRWQWFANGKPAGNKSVVEFTPDQPGIYSISLKVTDDSGFEESNAVESKLLQVNFPPEIRYSVSPESPAPNEKVTFNASQSSDPDGKISRVIWTFSDGQELTGPVVTRTYSGSGEQQVKLTVSDGSGFKNGTQELTFPITVNHSPIIVTETLIRSNSRTIRLDATQSYDPDGNPLKLEWILPDGTRRRESAFSWQAPRGGVHILSLAADDLLGRPNSKTTERVEVRINRPPVAVVDSMIRACTGQTILFSGSACSDPDGDGFSTLWDFGDSTSSTDTNPVKVYYQPGTYQVRLALDDGFTESPTVATIPVIIKGSPVARTSFPDTTIYVNTLLSFDGSASTDPNGPIGAFSWDFGNGDRDFGKTVNYIFREKGTYTVTLTVVGTQAGSCSNVSQAVSVVTVTEGPVAAFSGKEWIAAGESVTFNSESKAPGSEIKEWGWQIGDQDSTIRKEGKTISWQFNNPGLFSVRHRIEASGRSDCNSALIEKTIRVNAAPEIGWKVPDSVAFGDLIKLDAGATSDPDGVITDLIWSVNGKPVSFDPVFNFPITNPDSIMVSLQVSDNSPTANRTVIQSKKIVVNRQPEPAFSLPESLYEGQKVTLIPTKTTDADGDKLESVWLADGTILSGNVFTVASKPVVITLRQSDKRGFSNSVVEFSRTVTGQTAPSVNPVLPGRIISGTPISINSIQLPDQTSVIQPGVSGNQLVLTQTGNQTIQVGWQPTGETLKTWTFKVEVLDPIRFRSTPENITMIWNPANPYITLTAPPVNRTDLQSVQIDWFSGGVRLGSGFQLTVPLKKGVNRFTLTATDILVTGSQPVTTVWEVTCN